MYCSLVCASIAPYNSGTMQCILHKVTVMQVFIAITTTVSHSEGVMKIFKDGLFHFNGCLVFIQKVNHEMEKVALSHVVWRLLLKYCSCDGVKWSREGERVLILLVSGIYQLAAG